MRLIETPDNPIPAQAHVSALTTPDGVRLRWAAWPGRGAPAGTVCLLQGRAEFIEKYFETIDELRSRGLTVMTFDWRCQGLSQRALDDPRKDYVRSFAQYGTDLRSFLAEIVLGACARPLIGFAHSMGATILLDHMARTEPQFDRVVLTSPMIGFPGLRSSWPFECGFRTLNALGLGTAFIPGGGSVVMNETPFAGNLRTSDPARYRRTADIVSAEPALGLGGPTIGWTAAALAAMRELRARPPGRLACDHAVMVTAERDGIASVGATRALVARHANATMHTIGGGARHELLMESDRNRAAFWAIFDEVAIGLAKNKSTAPSS